MSADLIALESLQKHYEKELETLSNKIKNIKSKILSEKILAKKISDKNESWKLFRFARIRTDRDSDSLVDLNEVWRAYRYWYEAVGVDLIPRLTQTEVHCYFLKEFGIKPPQQRYRGIEVFMTEEDVEEWDAAKTL